MSAGAWARSVCARCALLFLGQSRVLVFTSGGGRKARWVGTFCLQRTICWGKRVSERVQSKGGCPPPPARAQTHAHILALPVINSSCWKRKVLSGGSSICTAEPCVQKRDGASGNATLPGSSRCAAAPLGLTVVNDPGSALAERRIVGVAV